MVMVPMRTIPRILLKAANVHGPPARQKRSNEPRHEKTGFLPMRKQRRRSATQ